MRPKVELVSNSRPWSASICKCNSLDKALLSSATGSFDMLLSVSICTQVCE